MTRTRASAKAAGSTFERQIADHLAKVIDDDRIDRRVKTGAKDRGDIGGVRHMGGRIVIECKNYGGRLLPGPWIGEAEIERGNDDALAPYRREPYVRAQLDDGRMVDAKAAAWTRTHVLLHWIDDDGKAWNVGGRCQGAADKG